MNDLVAQALRCRRGSRDVLVGVDLRVAPGELVLLAGRNGAGKSTLLRLLLGVERPLSGSVLLHGRKVTEWSATARARAMAFVPQDAEHPFEFTGRELVAMGRHAHRRRGEDLQEEDLEAVEQALVALDAVEFADRAVTTLSGGELRRIAVARALATSAPLLLLDEPTSNLDLEHALQLARLLRSLAAEGRGVLVASHDLNLMASHSDRVVVLHEGRVFCDGPAEFALQQETFRAVFGVRSATPSGYFPRDFQLP